MDEAIERAVGRAIARMRENLGDPLTIDDLSRSAMFSKFHFTRVFQRVTGLSPLRFLSAMRLQEAKRLLVSTSLTVAEISHRVGYRSVGTFSWRFTSSVGVSPAAYRDLGGRLPPGPIHNGPDAARQPTGTVHGAVVARPTDPVGRVFVGLFPERVPRGRPVNYVVLDRPGPYTLDCVLQGTWYLLARAVAIDGDEPRYLRSHGPISVRPRTAVAVPEVRLRPVRALDPPVLPAMLDPPPPALTACRSQSMR